jgi:hypothetical protein
LSEFVHCNYRSCPSKACVHYKPHRHTSDCDKPVCKTTGQIVECILTKERPRRTFSGLKCVT